MTGGNYGLRSAVLELLDSRAKPNATIQQHPEMEHQPLSRENLRKARRPNFTFDAMSIPVGAELASTAANGVSVRVIGPKKVELDGEEMFLTAATTKVLGVDYFVPPSSYWRYEGRLLRELYEEAYRE